MSADTQLPLATECAHRDQPARARGLCGPCYRAANLAERIAKTRNEAGAERVAVEVAAEWDRDPVLKAEFGRIMWEWVRAAKQEPIYIVREGRRERDHALELRTSESARAKAEKAATILGRAYVTEKVEEVKPRPLPLAGEMDTSGWQSAEDENDGESMEIGGENDEE